MQIVIDICESIKEHIEDGSYGKRPYDRYLLITAVLNGKSLPKGHGRLVDADALINQFPIWIDNFSSYVVNSTISKAPTIIEADTESEDKE